MKVITGEDPLNPPDWHRIRPVCMGQSVNFTVDMVRSDVYIARLFGGVSERLKETVLKTVVPHGTVGSNPTPTVIGDVRQRQNPYQRQCGEVREWLNRIAC